MIREFSGQIFNSLYDDSLALLLSDMEFRKCRFLNCVLSNTRDPRLRSTVRNVRLTDCMFDGYSLGPAVVEDVSVHNLKLVRELRTRGMAFKHVTISGRIGALVIAPLYPIGDGTEAEIKPINDANALYYREVDWALDIQNLECSYCGIRNIPAALIRRDPETQAVVRRANALDPRWRCFENTCWAEEIGFMIDEGMEDCVLVAGKKAPDFKTFLEGIRQLRAEGVADPD